VGRLFAHNQKTTDQTDIILTLTPHIIRVLDLTEDDLAAFRIGGNSTAPLIELPAPFDLPVNSESPAGTTSAAAPTQTPAPGQPPVNPIVPPPAR